MAKGKNKSSDEGIISRAAHAISDALTGGDSDEGSVPPKADYSAQGTSQPTLPPEGKKVTPYSDEPKDVLMSGDPLSESSLNEIQKHAKFDKFRKGQ